MRRRVLVTFTPAKQRAQVRTSSFLVPRGRTSNGVDFAQILEDYLNALSYDQIVMKPDRQLLLTGRPQTLTKPSKFINSPMGENSLRKVGQDIASYIGLESPERFTGHCFRR